MGTEITEKDRAVAAVQPAAIAVAAQVADTSLPVADGALPATEHGASLVADIDVHAPPVLRQPRTSTKAAWSWDDGAPLEPFDRTVWNPPPPNASPSRAYRGFCSYCEAIATRQVRVGGFHRAFCETCAGEFNASGFTCAALKDYALDVWRGTALLSGADILRDGRRRYAHSYAETRRRVAALCRYCCGHVRRDPDNSFLSLVRGVAHPPEAKRSECGVGECWIY